MRLECSYDASGLRSWGTIPSTAVALDSPSSASPRELRTEAANDGRNAPLDAGKGRDDVLPGGRASPFEGQGDLPLECHIHLGFDVIGPDAGSLAEQRDSC